MALVNGYLFFLTAVVTVYPPRLILKQVFSGLSVGLDSKPAFYAKYFTDYAYQYAPLTLLPAHGRLLTSSNISSLGSFLN